MNTPNPLLPQGALPPREKSSLYFKILMIFAVHVVVLGGLLMEGCGGKDTAKVTPQQGSAVADSSPMSPTSPDTYTPPAQTPVPMPPGGNVSTPIPPLPTAPATAGSTPAITTPTPTVTTTTTAALPKEASVYTIASGDMFSTIAKKNGVSIKALEDANPGIDPKKLQIGHKLQIPAGAAVASATPDATRAATDTTTAASGDTTTYVVKSGDVLLKIAKAHGTTVKDLQALNGMKTSAIKAGQPLKVPVMRVASAEAASSAAAAPATPAIPVSSGPARAN
jgi:LysM repeat protein